MLDGLALATTAGGVVPAMAMAAGAAVIGLRGGGLRHAPQLRIMCPRLERPVDCTIVQDVRNGQWKQVESCSAFAVPTAIECEQDCARRMNLGFALSAPQES